MNVKIGELGKLTLSVAWFLAIASVCMATEVDLGEADDSDVGTSKSGNAEAYAEICVEHYMFQGDGYATQGSGSYWFIQIWDTSEGQLDGLDTVEAYYQINYNEEKTGNGNAQVQVTLTVYEWSGSDWVWKASGLKNYYDDCWGMDTLSVNYEFGDGTYRFVLRTQTNFGASSGSIYVYTQFECGEYIGYLKVHD